MKGMRKWLLTVMASVAALAGIVGLAACSDKPETVDIGEQYKAVYEQYQAAVGEGAKSLEDWYAALTADIDAVNAGEVNEIAVVSIDSTAYIRLDFESGKVYLTNLTGGVH